MIIIKVKRSLITLLILLSSVYTGLSQDKLTKQLKEQHDIIHLKAPLHFKLPMLSLVGAYNTNTVTRSTQNNTKFLLGIGFVLFGIASVALYYLWNKTKQAKKTINQQNKELLQSLQEKEILMQEIHHRVKNNLQVISAYLQLQSAKIIEPSIKELFKGAENNIHSMITVHRLLYEHNMGDTVFINEYLTNLVEQMKKSFTYSDIDVSINGPKATLNIGKVVSLGLIISELFSNSCKHAFPNGTENAKINIELYKSDNGYCELIYKDNGIGVDLEELKKERKDSIGFRLIKLLGEEMDAKLIIDNKKGLSYVLTFFDKKNIEYNEDKSLRS